MKSCGLYSLLFFLTGLVAPAATPPGESKPETNVVRQLDANTLQIGLVRLERKERRLIIPAAVNMVEGPIEYFLVSAMGKLHESIFKTEAEPIHIQTAAMLLLGAPIATNARPEVHVSVRLKGKNLSAETLIDNVAVERRLQPDAWRYNGSRLIDGTFIAQRDGSIVSIISDPDAIIETGRVTAEDDENWRPSKKELPPVGMLVEVILTFPEKASKE